MNRIMTSQDAFLPWRNSEITGVVNEVEWVTCLYLPVFYSWVFWDPGPWLLDVVISFRHGKMSIHTTVLQGRALNVLILFVKTSWRLFHQGGLSCLLSLLCQGRTVGNIDSFHWTRISSHFLLKYIILSTNLDWRSQLNMQLLYLGTQKCVRVGLSWYLLTPDSGIYSRLDKLD